MSWWTEIEYKVFTYIKYYMSDIYPEMNFTTKNQNIDDIEFPTLLLHELTPVETGQDLDNTTVNAIISTIEIVVYTDTTETECKEIIGEATSLMKRLRFNISALPIVTTNNNISMAVARFNRVIGMDDTLY